MRRSVRIQEQDFSLEAVCKAMRDTHGAKIGALVTFTGLVREHNVHGVSAAQEEIVASLTLEHYPGMTEASIEKILARAEEKWPDLLEIVVVHRVGTMLPTDQIVLVAVACAHRDIAFAAAEFVMDYLKTDAIFWKLEQSQQGAHWVQSTNTDRQRTKNWTRE